MFLSFCTYMMLKRSVFHKIEMHTVYLNMKFVVALLIILSLFACGADTSGDLKSHNQTDSVLFIGNSYTYENDGIDKHLKFLLIGTENENTKVIRCTAKGRYHLLSHWNDPESKLLIKSKKWDKIVLQEYGSGAWKATEEFETSSHALAKDIRAINKNAEIFFNSTWNYKKSPGMEDSLYKEYTRVSKEINASVVPVGMLWKHLRSKINLYDIDGAHPNRHGTFVTACLFYEQLFNLDVRKTKNLDPFLPKSEQIKLKKWVHEFNLLAFK